MSLEKNSDGHPQVKAEIEIDATPEAVWQAIASLQGMKAWFMGMECDFDGQVGGKVTTKMGGQVIGQADIEAWDPPHKLVTRNPDPFGPGTPAMGYEWTIEAKDGGKCVLRMVQTLFSDDGAWDGQVGDTTEGWPAFFHVLRNYVERHAEQESGLAMAMGPAASNDRDEAFAKLTEAMGLGELTEGDSVTCDAEGAPAFSGTVEAIAGGRAKRAMIRLEQPCPGTAWIGVAPMSGNLTAVLSLYYYGAGAPAAGARDGALLNGWLQAQAQG